MILVIGSEASGKKEYVKSLGYTDDMISECIDDSRPVLYGLHKIVAANPEKIRDTLSRIDDTNIENARRAAASEAAVEKSTVLYAEFSSAPSKSAMPSAKINAAADKTNPADQWLTNLLEKEVIICNEVGSGIIPMLASERMYREQTGRLCTLLASRAEHVIRMVCGIAVKLK